MRFMAKKENQKVIGFWERGGSIVEYGLIIGFSIILFLVVIDMIMNIFGWSDFQIQDLFTWMP